MNSIVYTSASDDTVVHSPITSPIGIEQVPDKEGILPGYAPIGAKGNKIEKVREGMKKYKLQKPIGEYDDNQ